MKRLIAMSVMAVALCACSTAKKVSADYENVIPLPQEITVVHEPPFIIKKNTRILYPEGDALLKKNAEFLAGYIKESTGKQLSVEVAEEGNDGNAILLETDTAVGHPEGYELTVAQGKVRVKGRTPNGIFYGLQTLRKSIPAIATGADVILPAISIKDAPRFFFGGVCEEIYRPTGFA